MKTCEEQYQKAVDAMEAQDPKRAISLLCQAIDTFHRYVVYILYVQIMYTVKQVDILVHIELVESLGAI